jgi:hypothetical protein
MKKTLGLVCVAFCLFVGVRQSKADSACATATNLITNCGFQTGDFTGWNLSGNDVPGEEGNIYGVEGTDPDGISPNSGTTQAYFGDLDANAITLQQMISTIADDSYTVSFFVAQDTAPSNENNGEYSNELSASFGGTSLLSLTNVPMEGYTEYSYLVTATSSSSTLSLTLGNDIGYFLLDDVSVVNNTPIAATPEPPAWTMMLAGLLGSLLLWKSGVLAKSDSAYNVRP